MPTIVCFGFKGQGHPSGDGPPEGGEVGSSAGPPVQPSGRSVNEELDEESFFFRNPHNKRAAVAQHVTGHVRLTGVGEDLAALHAISQ